MQRGSQTCTWSGSFAHSPLFPPSFPRLSGSEPLRHWACSRAAAAAAAAAPPPPHSSLMTCFAIVTRALGAGLAVAFRAPLRPAMICFGAAYGLCGRRMLRRVLPDDEAGCWRQCHSTRRSRSSTDRTACTGGLRVIADLPVVAAVDSVKG